MKPEQLAELRRLAVETLRRVAECGTPKAAERARRALEREESRERQEQGREVRARAGRRL